ncbi:MAG TPA: exo-alpha-sialidase [Armatimonadetes bacterium]|nr:exo-alpha-sialidase [Armatimonadota bacterium]
MMELKETGIVYRNPKPHVWSRQAYFPSVVNLGGGELLCSMVIGQAFESPDCRVYLARSRDEGRTWSFEGRMLPEEEGDPYSEACRLTAVADGSVVALLFRYDRHRLEDGLANPETLGFVETRLAVCRSADGGRTWGAPEPIEPPLIGPEFELCCPIVELSAGDTWLLPTSTWRAWDGSDPTGMKAVAFLSRDGGRTWPDYAVVMDGARDGIIYWEQKIVELAPGRLLAVAWTYDERAGKDLPNAYAISEDGGRTFSLPRSTGLAGQTAALLALGDERVLCVFRRTDLPGLWAAEVSLAGGEWETERLFPLWGAPSVFTGGHRADMVSQFNVLRFGAPSVMPVRDGGAYVTFWCVEECVANIRWIRLG